MLSMFSRILPVSLMLLSLNGCVRNGDVRVNDTGCEWVRPIYVSYHDIDAMSAATQRAILGHNDTWEKNCFEKKN